MMNRRLPHRLGILAREAGASPKVKKKLLNYYLIFGYATAELSIRQYGWYKQRWHDKKVREFAKRNSPRDGN